MGVKLKLAALVGWMSRHSNRPPASRVFGHAGYARCAGWLWGNRPTPMFSYWPRWALLTSGSENGVMAPRDTVPPGIVGGPLGDTVILSIMRFRSHSSVR